MKQLLMLVATLLFATTALGADKPAKPPQAPPVRSTCTCGGTKVGCTCVDCKCKASTTTTTTTTTTTAPAVTYKWVCDGNKCWKVQVDTSTATSGTVGCASCQTVQTTQTTQTVRTGRLFNGPICNGQLFNGRIVNFLSNFRLFGGGCNCN